MPGWNLKKGKYISSSVNEDEYWACFNFVLSDACRKTNSYKFGLIKSLCDQIYTLRNENNGYFLSYNKLFFKFAENYWNLVSRYRIKQMIYNGTSELSRVERIIIDITSNYDIQGFIPFQSLDERDLSRVVSSVTSDCKRYVIGALYNDFEGKLYSFDLKGDGLYLHRDAYDFICKFKNEIERLNYYSWAKFLEKANNDEKTIRLLEKLELATPQRSDLSIYRKTLFEELHEDHCFYCGKEFSGEIHVDHFIPWSFVKSDNLWNFVLTCPKCNIQKKDSLVGKHLLSRLEDRNLQLMKKCHAFENSQFVIDEFQGYYGGLLEKMWEYAKRSGIKVRDDLFQ